MPITRTHVLATATVILSFIAAPRASAGPVTATWNGHYSYEIQYYDIYGHFIGTSVGGGPTTLSIFFEYYPPDIDSFSIMTIGNFGVSGIIDAGGSFGPQNAQGGIVNIYLPESNESGYFDVNFQSILSNGVMDTTDSSAVADITLLDYNGGSGFQFSFVSFATVPEPSSIVVAATAFSALATWGVVRRLFRWARRCGAR
jgi:hypothetical protein